MAQAVVDLLEVVDVHEQQRKAVAGVAAGMGQHLLQARQHPLAVGQIGQRVGAGLAGCAARLHRQCAALAGVDADPHKAAEHAIAIAQRAQVHVQPQVTPGTRAVRACLAQARAVLHRMVQVDGVVGFCGRAVQAFGGLPAGHFVKTPARQLRESGVDPFDAVFGIADQHHCVGVLGHAGPALQFSQLAGGVRSLLSRLLDHRADDRLDNANGQQHQHQAQRKGAVQGRRQRQGQEGGVEPAAHPALQGQVASC